jgi:hypothetical protein
MKSSTYDDSSGMPATPEKALCGSVSAKKVQAIYFHRVGYPGIEDRLCIPLGDDPTRHVKDALIHRVLIEPADA